MADLTTQKAQIDDFMERRYGDQYGRDGFTKGASLTVQRKGTPVSDNATTFSIGNDFNLFVSEAAMNRGAPGSSQKKYHTLAAHLRAMLAAPGYALRH